MEKNNPKNRPLTTLEWFLVGLVKFASVDNSYRLRHSAGLSWGGIRPSLVRLERWGFLERSDTGTRRKKAFRLTANGERELYEHWEQALDPGADLESVIRAAWLAYMARPSRALEFLHKAIQDRQSDSQIRTEARWVNQSTALGQFDQMRIFGARRRLESEAEILAELLTQLRKQYKCDTADR